VEVLFEGVMDFASCAGHLEVAGIELEGKIGHVWKGGYEVILGVCLGG